MKYVSEYRKAELVQVVLSEIVNEVTQSWVIMEICGGQTHAIVRHGLDQLLPEKIELVHGPGCGGYPADQILAKGSSVNDKCSAKQDDPGIHCRRNSSDQIWEQGMRAETNKMFALVSKAREKAAAGVDYSSRTGALCPFCGKKAKIYRTTPWDGTTRTRYHRCRNTKCLIASLGITIKSVEEDRVVQEPPVGPDIIDQKANEPGQTL